MSKFLATLIFSAAFLLVACGGGNKTETAPTQEVEAVEVVLTEDAEATEEFEAEEVEAEEVEAAEEAEATEE